MRVFTCSDLLEDGPLLFAVPLAVLATMLLLALLACCCTGRKRKLFSSHRKYGRNDLNVEQDYPLQIRSHGAVDTPYKCKSTDFQEKNLIFQPNYKYQFGHSNDAPAHTKSTSMSEQKHVAEDSNSSFKKILIASPDSKKFYHDATKYDDLINDESEEELVFCG